MIAALLIWSFLCVLAYIYGAAVIAALARFLRPDSSVEPGIPLILLAGLGVLTVLAQTANLFIPLGAIFILILLAGAIWLAFWNRSIFQISFPRYSWLGWFFISLAFLTVLENAMHFAANPDTGFYHAQTIRWFETYRIVPGLGNLQERFAFNSAWLVLNAALSLAFLGIQSFRLVNGLIFLIAMLFFAEGLQELSHKKLTAAGFARILFLVLSFYLLGSEISSVGNDMPITLLTWVILVLWLERLESPAENGFKTFLIFLLPVFALTVKLSSLPLMLFPLHILVEQTYKRDWRQARFLILTGSVIVLPWLIRGVILSGYLVFPFSQLDLLTVDWKMPASQAEVTRQAITGFARFGDDWQSALGLPVTEWAPVWFKNITVNRKAILWLTLFSPVLLFIGRLLQPARVTKEYLFAWAAMYAGSAFWFLSAPDIRFGYGFLIGTCALAVVPATLPALLRLDRAMKFFSTLTLLFLIAFQTLTLWRSIEFTAYPGRLLLPADYRPSGARACEIHGAVIYCRNAGAQCQYELFPCIPYPRPEAQLRGETFQSGFRDASTGEP